MPQLDPPSTERRFKQHFSEGIDRAVSIMCETLARLLVPCDDVLKGRIREMVGGFALDVRDRLDDPDALIVTTTNAIRDLIVGISEHARVLTPTGEEALRAGIEYGLTSAVGRFLKAEGVLLSAARADKLKEGCVMARPVNANGHEDCRRPFTQEEREQAQSVLVDLPATPTLSRPLARRVE